MSAATLATSSLATAILPTESVTPGYIVPDALQQVLRKIEDQRNVNQRASEDLRFLKADLERRWRIASSAGLTSSTTLYQILEYGWREWRRLTA